MIFFTNHSPDGYWFIRHEHAIPNPGILLLEDGTALLLQNGSTILLEHD